ncbi:hypothetical protein [Shewanella sp.]|uniref:hypothetical protein n=1 Tax=Shewanella sp. TaxID=50422 RepID=UPI003A982865
MPQIIRTFDEIAAEMQGELLFFKSEQLVDERGEFGEITHYGRERVEMFCKNHGIEYEVSAAPIWSGWVVGGPRYIVLKVPYEESNTHYQLLVNEFENEDGSPKDPNLVLYFIDAQNLVDQRKEALKRNPNLGVSEF